MRFKITYAQRVWRPWELSEQFEERGWLGTKRYWWYSIGLFNTKDEAEARLQEIITGENAIRPSYYDERGNPECWAH